jgi:hypothetical protein
VGVQGEGISSGGFGKLKVVFDPAASSNNESRRLLAALAGIGRSHYTSENLINPNILYRGTSGKCLARNTARRALINNVTAVFDLLLLYLSRMVRFQHRAGENHAVSRDCRETKGGRESNDPQTTVKRASHHLSPSLDFGTS